MHWTIARRLTALGAAGALLATGLSAASWRTFGSINTTMEDLGRSQTVLRHHMQADMMHDAIRADVLSALMARSADEHAAARSDFEEHSTSLASSVSSAREAVRDADLVSGFEGVGPALRAYVAAADTMLRLAQEDRATAMQRYPAFLEAFSNLEEPMSSVSDLIEQRSAQVTATSAQRVSFARRGNTLLALAGAIFLLVAAALTRRAILRPIDEVRTRVRKLGEGDLTVEFAGRSQDECGEMERDLNRTVAAMRTSIAEITSAAHALAAASEELSAVSSQIGATAEETSAQAGTATAAVHQVTGNIQTVAAGSEQMSASIKEIASNAATAAKVASGAVVRTEQATITMSQLGSSSQEIGAVIKTINGIAEQTNLLALNATIEAARAGEAGKGFAVVAHEVKELAKETARATEDIARRIEAIQGDAKGAVSAIHEVAGVIRNLNDISGTIAAAVEQQSATTDEIARNVDEASKGASEIVGTINHVSTAAMSTSQGVQNSRQAAGELAEMAQMLQGLVSRFRVQAAQAA